MTKTKKDEDFYSPCLKQSGKLAKNENVLIEINGFQKRSNWQKKEIYLLSSIETNLALTVHLKNLYYFGLKLKS